MFNHVLIVGPGLIGGSLGLGLRTRGLARRVTGVGRRQESLEKALAVGAVDDTTLDLLEHAGDADLIVLATAVGLIGEQSVALAPKMGPKAILTDVGSVKESVCRAAETALLAAARGTRFVGGHPLAGSEQRGVDAAREDLFTGALCLLTPSPATDPDGRALARLRDMWEALDCRVREMSAATHDRLLAQSSHLPHVLAAALVNAVADEALEIAARGFLDTTRIASGDAALWRDICLANRPALLEALRRLDEQTAEFRRALKSGDAAAIERFLANAKNRRDARLKDG